VIKKSLCTWRWICNYQVQRLFDRPVFYVLTPPFIPSINTHSAMNIKTSTLLFQLFLYEDLLKSNCHNRTQALGQPLYYWLSHVFLFITRCKCVSESCSYVFKTLWFFFYTIHGKFRRVCQICKKRLSASSYVTVRLSARNNSAPTEQISVKFNIWVLFSNICPEN
jgi:hypothetical protein